MQNRLFGEKIKNGSMSKTVYLTFSKEVFKYKNTALGIAVRKLGLKSINAIFYLQIHQNYHPWAQKSFCKVQRPHLPKLLI